MATRQKPKADGIQAADEFTSNSKRGATDSREARTVGLAAYRRGELRTAVTALEQAVAEDATDSEARVFLMRALWSLDDKDSARAVATTILPQTPRHEEAIHVVARVHHERDEFEEALGWWCRLASLRPTDLELALRVARLASRLGDFTLAQQHAQRALDRDPTQEEALQLAVNAAYRGGDDQALLSLLPIYFLNRPRRAIELLHRLRPRVTVEDIADTLTAMHAQLDATAPTRRGDEPKSLLLDAQLEIVNRWLTAALSDEVAGRKDQAARHYRAARRLDPTTASPGLARLKAPHIQAMRAALATDDADQAVRHARLAAEVDPDDLEAQFTAGRVLLLQGNADEAVPYLEATAKSAPQRSWYRLNLARAYEKSGAIVCAARAYTAVTNLLRAEADHRLEAQGARHRLFGPCIQLARELLQQERWGDAMAAVQLAASLRPSHEAHHQVRRDLLRALYLRVRAAYKDGDDEALTSTAERYLEWNNDHQDVLQMLGRAHMRARRYDLALPLWERLATLKPEDHVPHLQIARCADWLRDGPKARDAALRALARDFTLDEARQIVEKHHVLARRPAS